METDSTSEDPQVTSSLYWQKLKERKTKRDKRKISCVFLTFGVDVFSQIDSPVFARYNFISLCFIQLQP